jgi:hypothetical protein
MSKKAAGADAGPAGASGGEGSEEGLRLEEEEIETLTPVAQGRRIRLTRQLVSY